jgi:asparagine synthase (glutamine-hydrolysing)
LIQAREAAMLRPSTAPRPREAAGIVRGAAMFHACVSRDLDDIAAMADRWRRETAATDEFVWADRHLVVRAPASCAAVQESGLSVWGSARLDDCPASGRMGSGREALAFLQQTIDGRGWHGVSDLSGRLGAIVWNARTCRLSGIRDALGLAPLFYRISGDRLHVADSTEAFADGATLCREFLAGFLATGYAPEGATIWQDVREVPAGSVLDWTVSGRSTRTFWSAANFTQRTDGDLAEDAQEFGRLVRHAVTQSLDPDGSTWADLSGGLDSSTVVSVAALEGERDRGRQLGGTLTYVGSIGDEDETRFVDAVLQRYPVRNLRFGDDWPWRHDGEPAPRAPQPFRDYPFYARDRHCARTLAGEGVTTLLSGNGPDNYLPQTTLHLPDLLWTGRVRDGAREVWASATASRQRLWKTVASDLVFPVLPAAWQRWAVARRIERPDWMRTEFLSQAGFERAIVAREINQARAGAICQTRVARRFTEMSWALLGWRPLAPVTIHHPLLYRPLVEFCLQLPHAHRTSMERFKPVLRAAMRGIVPDAVLARRTKGFSLLTRYGWAIARERQLMSRLLDDSLLAELGCIEPARFRVALERTRQGRPAHLRAICLALSLETWLAVRFGRYDELLATTRRTDNERAEDARMPGYLPQPEAC